MFTFFAAEKSKSCLERQNPSSPEVGHALHKEGVRLLTGDYSLDCQINNQDKNDFAFQNLNWESQVPE